MGGERVWESRSTYLCRQVTEGPIPEKPPTEEAPAPLPVRATWELPSSLGRRYAAASGDCNPIHLHPLAAKLFGFPRHIAHGMWTFARCLAEAGTPEHFTARAEFRAPVLLPGTVTYGSRNGTFEVRGGVRDEVRGASVRTGSTTGGRLPLTGRLERNA